MTDTIKDTERLLRLSGYFGRRQALLTGRDTTALMLLIDKLTAPDGRVILPAISCMTRLASVLNTGRKPVIIDVGEDLNMDPGRLAEVCREGDMVLATHEFGIPCALDEIVKICEDKGATLIEDASQSIGGKYNEKPLGSFGRASILSFADGKLWPTSGGGALITDDKDLVNELEPLVDDLPVRPADYRDKKNAFIQEFNPYCRKAWFGDHSAVKEWQNLHAKYSDIYYFRINPVEADAISDAVGDFDDRVDKRRGMAYLYHKNMAGLPITIPTYPVDSAVYRFTFIFSENTKPEDIDNCVKDLKGEGVGVNRLYLPLTWLAPDLIETEGCPYAESIGPRMVNLRVDTSTTRAHCNLAGVVVGRYAKE